MLSKPSSIQSSLAKSAKLKNNMKKIKIDEQLLRQWKVTPLSRDHKPNCSDEQKRINKVGGTVSKIKDESGKSVGPYRVFDEYGLNGGLAISRSIGDHALNKSGVIPDPEIKEYEYSERDKALIIASDGVWEFLSNEDILQLMDKVRNGPTNIKKHVTHNIMSKLNYKGSSNLKNSEYNFLAKSLSESIIKISKYYWGVSGVSFRDDITVVVVFLNPLD